ncbi:hypothetical protein GEMRC1_009010 [Eukaryota sp. GEM-RC1]
MKLLLLAVFYLLQVAASHDVLFKSVSVPPVSTSNVPFSIHFKFALKTSDYADFEDTIVRFAVTLDDRVYSDVNVTLTDERIQSGSISDILLDSLGRHRLSLSCTSCPNSYHSFQINTLPGFFTILPQILIIVTAIVTKQVIPSLFIGLFVASLFIWNFNPITALFKTMTEYLVYALIDVGHAKLILFFIVLGGLIGVVSRSGGSMGLARLISKVAKTSTKGMIGLCCCVCTVFIDEFSNVLLTGLAIRPVLEKLRVSPAKLSFLLDSLAAPISSVAIITSWIGFQVSLIRAEVINLDLDYDPFILFLKSIPFSFYPLVTIAFVLLNIATRRDFGPMYVEEMKYRGSLAVSDEDQQKTDEEKKS